MIFRGKLAAQEGDLHLCEFRVYCAPLSNRATAPSLPDPMRLIKLIAICVLITTACGCSLLPGNEDKTKDWSASKLYTEAKDALSSGEYETAIKYFETLEARYPFGRYAQQAQMEVAYAYYKQDEAESAIAAADRFIKLHPRHPNVDYMYYLKGLANFNRGRDLVDKYLPQDPSQRDSGAARESFFAFGELVKKFPDSKYAADARQRMLFLRNNLALYEVHVANYYMRRGAYLAAANRGKYVVENYQGAPAMRDALRVMEQAYRKLGLEDLATDAHRVLMLNYPNTADADTPSQPDQRGWLEKLLTND